MMADSWRRWLYRRPPMDLEPQHGPVALNPLLSSISPLQLWLDRLVALVNSTGTLETRWLPVFTIASSRLRSVFAKIQSGRHARARFFCQWETGGMLILGVALEAGRI